MANQTTRIIIYVPVTNTVHRMDAKEYTHTNYDILTGKPTTKECLRFGEFVLTRPESEQAMMDLQRSPSTPTLCPDCFDELERQVFNQIRQVVQHAG
jgi:hypothetical protein